MCSDRLVNVVSSSNPTNRETQYLPIFEIFVLRQADFRGSAKAIAD